MKRTFTREFKRQVASQALAGEKQIMVKVIDVFGVDTTAIVRVRV